MHQSVTKYHQFKDVLNGNQSPKHLNGFIDIHFLPCLSQIFQLELHLHPYLAAMPNLPVKHRVFLLSDRNQMES